MTLLEEVCSIRNQAHTLTKNAKDATSLRVQLVTEWVFGPTRFISWDENTPKIEIINKQKKIIKSVGERIKAVEGNSNKLTDFLKSIHEINFESRMDLLKQAIELYEATEKSDYPLLYTLVDESVSIPKEPLFSIPKELLRKDGKASLDLFGGVILTEMRAFLLIHEEEYHTPSEWNDLFISYLTKWLLK